MESLVEQRVIRRLLPTSASDIVHLCLCLCIWNFVVSQAKAVLVFGSVRSTWCKMFSPKQDKKRVVLQSLKRYLPLPQRALWKVPLTHLPFFCALETYNFKGSNWRGEKVNTKVSTNAEPKSCCTQEQLQECKHNEAQVEPVMYDSHHCWYLDLTLTCSIKSVNTITRVG